MRRLTKAIQTLFILTLYLVVIETQSHDQISSSELKPKSLSNRRQLSTYNSTFVESSTHKIHRRVLLVGLPFPGGSLLTLILAQIPKSIAFRLNASSSLPSFNFSNVPSDFTIILEATIGGLVSYPTLLRSFRPHATALFLGHPDLLYQQHSPDGYSDAILRLTEKLFIRRDTLFNTTVFLDEVVTSRAILLPKLKLLGFTPSQVKRMLELRLPLKALERATEKRCSECDKQFSLLGDPYLPIQLDLYSSVAGTFTPHPRTLQVCPRLSGVYKSLFPSKFNHSLSDLGRSTSDLLQLVSVRQKDKVVIMTFADNRWLDMLLNWMICLHEINVTNYIVMSLELELHTWLLDKGAPSFLFSVQELKKGNSDESFRHRLWYYRWKMMGEVLQSGVSVLHSDADAVWVNDPSPLFKQSTASVIAGRGANREDWLICMGWIFFRASQNILDIFPIFLKRIRAIGDDQRALNLILKNVLNVKWNKSPFSSGGYDETYTGVSKSKNWEEIEVLLLPNSAIRRFFCNEHSRNTTLYVLHCREVLNKGESTSLRMTQGESALGKSTGVRFMGSWKLASEWKHIHYPTNTSSMSAWSAEPWMALRQSNKVSNQLDAWSYERMEAEFSLWVLAICDKCIAKDSQLTTTARGVISTNDNNTDK